MRWASRIACLVIGGSLLLAVVYSVKSRSREVDTDFNNYPAIARGIEAADRLVLYEGLPHQFHERSVFEEELRKPHVLLHDYPFYTEPIELNPTDASELSKLATTPSNFTPWRGLKKCGGYHPDYAVEWHGSDGLYRCLACLGCWEVKLFGPHCELYCDMTDETKQKLGALFKPCRKNRPERHHE